MHLFHVNPDTGAHNGLRLALIAGGGFFTAVTILGLLQTNTLAGLVTCLTLVLAYLLYEFVLRHAKLLLHVLQLRFIHYRETEQPIPPHEIHALTVHEHAAFAGIVQRLHLDWDGA